jgi:hypothetical protein
MKPKNPTRPTIHPELISKCPNKAISKIDTNLILQLEPWHIVSPIKGTGH